MNSVSNNAARKQTSNVSMLGCNALKRGMRNIDGKL
jgi:hypothetical protein